MTKIGFTITRFRSACLCLILLIVPLFGQPGVCPRSPDCSCGFAPNDPWGELQAGFARFLNTRPLPRVDKCARCCGVWNNQTPFAVVLSCSDSRVPPEVLFNQGLGDLFVVRVAGNVASDEAIGSIEYAIAHLKTIKLIVVLGHEKCGAVTSALSADPAHDMLPSFLNRIYPAVTPGSTVEQATKDNVRYTVKLLPRYSPIIRNGVPAPPCKAGDAGPQPIPPPKIVGAYYSMEKGMIETVPVN